MTIKKKKKQKVKILSHVQLCHQVAKDVIGFCTAKENSNKMKRQPIHWEEISANDVTYKYFLITKIYK